jgi:hypothetical protein
LGYSQYFSKITEEQYNEFNESDSKWVQRKNGDINLWTIRVKSISGDHFYFIDKFIIEKGDERRIIRSIQRDLIPWISDCKYTLNFIENLVQYPRWGLIYASDHPEIIEKIIGFYNLSDDRKKLSTRVK